MELHALREDMKRKFLMSDLGALSYYFSIEVCQARSGITISQKR